MQDQAIADVPEVAPEPTDEQLREVMTRARRQHPVALENVNRGGLNEAGAERDWPCARCRNRRSELEDKIKRIERGITGSVFVGRKDSEVEREMAMVSFRVKLRELPPDGQVRQTFMADPLNIWGPLCCARCNTELEAEAVADNQRREDEDRAFEAKQRERRLIASGLPVEYARGRRGTEALESADAPRTRGFQLAREECARVIVGAAERPWIWLWERDGGGFKTTLMALAIRHAIELGLEALFVNWGDFVLSLRDFDGEPETKRYERLRKVAILGTDDLGVEKPSRASGEALYHVVDARYHTDSGSDDGTRGIIFTSNCSIAEYVARFSGVADDSRMATRLERRLMEMSTEISIFS
jgi:hypothetical protein